jgi:sn-glycerol 3-phosphate transport system substrate-binding protein
VFPVGISAERKAAAWEFLTWLIETKQAAAWSRETGYIPVRESARALLEKEGFYRDNPEFETAIKELAYSRESPQLQRWGAFAKIVDDSTMAILRYNAPALETLNAAERNANELMDSRTSAER